VINDPARIEMSILRTARVLRRAFNSSLAPFGLNLTEASLMSFIRQHGPLSQRQLADLLQISRPFAGTVIDSLERRGLVSRQADPTDRRVWLIHLTIEADAFVDAFEEVDRSLRADFRKGLSREERRHLAELLLCVEDNGIGVIAALEDGPAEREGLSFLGSREPS
jgi:MarR family transcriptional regulator, transcriptional regulator for hemolysin